MFLDDLVKLSTAQAITSTAASSSIYDVTGAGSGNAPNMIGGVTSSGNALIGFDIGAGDGMAIPEVFVDVTTAFTTGDGATLTIALQAAPDNGSNAPGTYVTLTSTAALTAAQLTAAASFQFQVPPVPKTTFGLAQPRFYRLNYIVGTGTFSAGAVSSNIVLNPSQATKIQNYPSNFIA
jgi:hypothetical protein